MQIELSSVMPRGVLDDAIQYNAIKCRTMPGYVIQMLNYRRLVYLFGLDST